MKPPRFAYQVPHTVDEAVALKREYGAEASFLAGGQSLMPMINMRLARPAVLIDLNRLSSSAYVRELDGGATVEIGALTRYRAVETDPTASESVPLLRQGIQQVAHRVVRNRGTIGGSVAHADAAAELPAALVALKARIVVRGAAGEREIDAEDFFEFHFTTVLLDDEMVIAVRVPRQSPHTGSAFVEVSRRHGDFAIVAVAAVVDGGGAARYALAGVGSRPIAIETDEDDPGQAAVSAVEALGFADDLVASSAYRRRLLRVLVRRARERALADGAQR